RSRAPESRAPRRDGGSRTSRRRCAERLERTAAALRVSRGKVTSAPPGSSVHALLGFQERRDLAAELLLDALDGSASVHGAEVELVGHRRVLPEQLVLICAEAVVDVVAVLQVHA